MKHETKIITSSGVIRNPEKPRVGVISANSELLSPDNIMWLLDINDCINISYEDYIAEKKEEIRDCLEEQGFSGECFEYEFYRLFEQACEVYESDGDTYLIGDWIFDEETKSYLPDKQKEFAAIFNSDTNNICVEWSRYIRRCHHTSPCYVMADGSGPCGDLDTNGDAVVAYDLPGWVYLTDKFQLSITDLKELTTQVLVQEHEDQAFLHDIKEKLDFFLSKSQPGKYGVYVDQIEFERGKNEAVKT